MANFSEMSKKHENDSVVQKSASEIFSERLEIQPKDDVLDLDCGTGHISRLISNKTSEKIVGADSSNEMIGKVQEKFSKQDISLRICLAKQLDYQEGFDIIFCNSALLWFVGHAKILDGDNRNIKMHEVFI